MTLNIPTGLWGGKKQFSPEEIEHSKKIARARIHVERAIKYIKDFKIIKNTVNRALLPRLTKMIYCCAMLTNFQTCHISEVAPQLAKLAPL